MVNARRLLAIALAIGMTATGCDSIIGVATGSFKTNGFSGDPYPISIDTDSGAVIIGVQESGGDRVRTGVFDLLSPITVFDRGVDAAPAVVQRDLTIYAPSIPGGEPDIPRGRFSDRDVVTLHPCSQSTEACEVGTPATPRPFDALIGIDVLSSDALRLRVSTNEMFIFPDIAGDDPHRSRSCDAVFPSPFRGGGTLILGGTELAFGNSRIAIDTCIAPAPYAELPQRERGVDALLVLSTAIGTTLLNTATYERYRELDPLAPAIDTLPEHTVLLPSGPVTGRLTDIPSLALVGNLSSNPRAPCRQVWAHHLLAERNCAEADDCPCATDSGNFCPVPAIVELKPAARLPILVVPNDNPTLQALRTELRPDRPEVDGILGTDALQALEIDIDRAHHDNDDRVLMRCVDRVTCGARITLADTTDRAYIRGCLSNMPGPFP